MKRMTMATICSGAVQEKVDRALRAVADNILDPNTDARKKRSITLKITFVPNEDDREDITVLVDVTKSLAPDAGVKTQLFVAKDLETGAITVQEHQRGEINGGQFIVKKKGAWIAGYNLNDISCWGVG